MNATRLDRATIRVFVTKYALTSGIQEVEGELFAEGTAVKYGDYWQSAHGEGKDWHRTLEGAKKRAEEMRNRKIASLRKSISAMEKLTF